MRRLMNAAAMWLLSVVIIVTPALLQAIGVLKD